MTDEAKPTDERVNVKIFLKCPWCKAEPLTAEEYEAKHEYQKCQPGEWVTYEVIYK